MKKIYSLILTFIIAQALSVTVSAQAQVNVQAVENNIRAIATNAPVLNTYNEPLTIVNDVDNFLNRPVRIQAKFDKFTTLGLDYPPAMRKSEDFISFMVQRNDVVDHNVPLSELKLFMKRKYAEGEVNICPYIGAWNKGKKQSAEICLQKSLRAKGKIWINNGIESKMIRLEAFQEYQEKGYVKGRLTFKRTKK